MALRLRRPTRHEVLVLLVALAVAFTGFALLLRDGDALAGRVLAVLGAGVFYALVGHRAWTARHDR